MKKHLVLYVIIGIILVIGVSSSHAVPPRLEVALVWMGTEDTNWNNADNWLFEGEETGAVPNAGTDVKIINGKPRVHATDI